MPAGRPTEYTEKILKKAKKYLDLCKDEETIKAIGEKEVFRLKVKLPSIEGLARFLSVARSTIYEWEKEHEEFSDILEDVKTEQAERLINNGLSGDYNSTIAKLILTKHDYSDKSETDITSKGKQLESTVIQIIKPDAVENPDVQTQPEAIPSVGTPDGQDND